MYNEKSKVTMGEAMAVNVPTEPKVPICNQVHMIRQLSSECLNTIFAFRDMISPYPFEGCDSDTMKTESNTCLMSELEVTYSILNRLATELHMMYEAFGG